MFNALTRRKSIQFFKMDQNANTFEFVDGWKILNLKCINEALAMAQRECAGCREQELVMVEVNRETAREELACKLAIVCLTCGKETIFPSSSPCRPEHAVNTTFRAALGEESFWKLVGAVVDDKSVKPVEIRARNEDGLDPASVKQEPMEEEGDPKSRINVKEEPPEEEEEADEWDYRELEPSIQIEEGGAVKLEPTQPLVGGGQAGEPQVDVSTITANNPTLGLATVVPNTPVMGGKVTPWPPASLVHTHPKLFIRTTCSKINLPPGLYKYQRNNGLQSVLAVRADGGTFDGIEQYYSFPLSSLMVRSGGAGGVKEDKRRADTTVKKTSASSHRPTALQLFSSAQKPVLEQEGWPRRDWDQQVIQRWARLPAEEKAEYQQRALHPGGILPPVPPPAPPPAPPKEKQNTTNIPLPALKKFALVVAPQIKQKKPQLAKIENRGQLNKCILERWLALSSGEQETYRRQAASRSRETKT